jgi:amidase
MSEWAFRSATELAAAIRARQIGAQELLEHYLARVERFNPKLNAIVNLRAEHARERARAADQALAKGEVWGPLHGVPMTVKESYNIAGLPTTWGDPKQRNNVAREDAVVVERLQRAGAIIFGKTNVPLMLQDMQSYNEIYGQTGNPWDIGRTPGGSSGGSAAALAAGLSALESGSDIGGSIRNPAHFCGVYGLKPTHNVYPMRGHSLGGLAPVDISVVGPLARAPEDLALSLEVCAGADLWHAPGWTLTLPGAKSTRLKDWRIAVWLDDPHCAVDAAVSDRIAAAAQALARAGATVSLDARPDFDTGESHRAFIALLRAATSGRMPDALYDEKVRLAAQLAGDDCSYRALEARGITIRHRDWLAANERRFALRVAWRHFFERWDALLCPISPTTAFPHDHEPDRIKRTLAVNGKRTAYSDQLFWAGIAGIAYLPATVAPVGLAADGLPVGVQIVGPEYGDRGTIELARLLAREIGGFRAPRGFE